MVLRSTSDSGCHGSFRRPATSSCGEFSKFDEAITEPCRWRYERDPMFGPKTARNGRGGRRLTRAMNMEYV